MITRTADARWAGDLKTGTGTLRLGSGVFEGQYSFPTRFEQAPGTNPEELLGAAHAACFTMALNNMLATAGHLPKHVSTTASVNLERVDGAMTISGITLKTQGSVPGITPETFREHAENAKKTCIVSRALAAVPMTVEASLV